MPSNATIYNLQAMGDKLLEEATALHEQIPVLVKQARKLEYEAFAFYARAQAIEEARKIVANQKPLFVEDSSQCAAVLGRIGGKKRAESLSPERRSEIARQAVLTRFGKNHTSN